MNSVCSGGHEQVNTAAAEVLYKTILVFAALSPEHTCLDVCCGTGTIGIVAAVATGCKVSNSASMLGALSGTIVWSFMLVCLSVSLRQVIGIELCKPAVQDAVENATANSVQNAEFICGRAEHVLPGVLRRPELSNANLTAICDPPREGLHSDCARGIRNCPDIKRLIYVSCNPTKSLPRDLLVLCGAASKKQLGLPFRVVRTAPIDMFPHCEHIELVRNSIAVLLTHALGGHLNCLCATTAVVCIRSCCWSASHPILVAAKLTVPSIRSWLMLRVNRPHHSPFRPAIKVSSACSFCSARVRAALTTGSCSALLCTSA